MDSWRLGSRERPGGLGVYPKLRKSWPLLSNDKCERNPQKLKPALEPGLTTVVRLHYPWPYRPMNFPGYLQRICFPCGRDQLQLVHKSSVADARLPAGGPGFPTSVLCSVGWKAGVFRSKRRMFGDRPICRYSLAFASEGRPEASFPLLVGAGAGGGSVLHVRDGLDAHYVEPLAAAHILAAHHVFPADHVTPGLGKTHAVLIIGAARQMFALTADQPAQRVLITLSTMRAGHHVDLLFRLFVEKVAFFHRLLLPRPRASIRLNRLFEVRWTRRQLGTTTSQRSGETYR